jgi:hypothetical protein
MTARALVPLEGNDEFRMAIRDPPAGAPLIRGEPGQQALLPLGEPSGGPRHLLPPETAVGRGVGGVQDAG